MKEYSSQKLHPCQEK